MATMTERASETAGQVMGKISGTAQTPASKLPTDVFMWAAGASVAGSLAFKIAGRQHDALFVGQWAPTFLLLGIISKLARNFGND
jgi:hypothetical protein